MTTRVNPGLIRGIQPVIDRRVTEQAYVLNGRNFLFSPQGPKSGFGATFATFDALSDPRGCATFRVGTRSFILCDDSVLDYDEISQSYVPVFIFDTAATVAFPWSHAEVNDVDYFAKKGVGIVIYDSTLDEWSAYVDVALPVDPRAVAEANGRLIIVSANAITISELDDGQNITPSIELGVFTQALSALTGKSEAFAVFRSPDGFTVFTSKGIVRALRSEAVAPFRFERTLRAHRPINPFCVISIDDGIQLFIDRKGIFTISSGSPELFDPAFSEFIANELLPTLKLEIDDIMRLFYASDQKLLFISVSDPADSAVYSKAFVLFLPRQDWGIFNLRHTTFGEVQLEIDPDTSYELSYFDEIGTIKTLSGEQFVETRPLQDDAYFHRAYSELPARKQNTIYHMPSTGYILAHPRIGDFKDLITGYYRLQDRLNLAEAFPDLTDPPIVASSDTGLYFEMRDGSDMRAGAVTQTWQVSQLTNNPLDSEIEVGLFRIIDPEREDRMTIFQEVTTYADPGTVIETEDYMLLFGEEDWLTTGANEDWGADFVAVGFDFTLTGTNDGFSTFLASVGQEQQRDAESIVWAVDSNGLFHTAKLTADKLLQSFHLKSLVLDGRIGGRY